MAELAATVGIEIVANLTAKNKLVVLSVTPTTTSDVITFDASTSGVYTRLNTPFNKIISCIAVDGSTGMSKSISHNGSTVLTTRGWVLGDNKWFIWLVAQQDFGEVI